MRFWFGKKESGPDAQPVGTAVETAAKPEFADKGGDACATPEIAFVLSEQAGAETVSVVPPGVAGQQAGAPIAAGVVVQAEKPVVPALPAVDPAAQAEAAKSGLAVPAAGLNKATVEQKPFLKPVAKLTLKPVNGQVTMAVRPAVEAPAVAPAVPAAGVTAAAAMAGRPTFALRPKVESAVATAEEKGVVERDADNAAMIRPKGDQRALYYQLMNGLYDAVLVLDDEGHVVDCNTRVSHMLGYSREEAWDLPIGKVITGMVSQMFEHLKRNLAENHHILMDARCFRKDGTSFAGEVGVSTISLTRGKNIVFAIRNVERRKSAMDDLRKSQAALEIAFAPTFVCDSDGFFVVVNQALLEVFGIPDADQAKAVRFMDLLPEAARLFLRASCGEKVRETLNVSTPDGQPVKLQLALVPVQSGQNVSGVAGSILHL